MSCGADLFATVLKSLFDDNTDAYQNGGSLTDDGSQCRNGLSASEKIIHNEHSLFPLDKFSGDDHLMPHLLGIGMSGGRIMIASNGRCWVVGAKTTGTCSSMPVVIAAAIPDVSMVMIFVTPRLLKCSAKVLPIWTRSSCRADDSRRHSHLEYLPAKHILTRESSPAASACRHFTKTDWKEQAFVGAWKHAVSSLRKLNFVSAKTSEQSRYSVL
jgi:hypothetical protein